MSDQPAFSYLQAAAHGASPIGQVILLYDTILRDFARAIAAQAAGDIEGRVAQLNHALTVIGHLESVLDHERGGDAAKHFARFYDVTRGLIVTANAKATPESLEQLISLYSRLRQAWYRADQQLTVRELQAPFSEPPSQKPGAQANGQKNADEETPPRHWST